MDWQSERTMGVRLMRRQNHDHRVTAFGMNRPMVKAFSVIERLGCSARVALGNDLRLRVPAVIGLFT